MSYECFDVTENAGAPGVTHLRMIRPDQRNTMIAAFWAELPQIVRELSDGGQTRALVLSSTGKHFTAGMDLGMFDRPPAAVPGRDEPLERGRIRARLREQILLMQAAFTALETARMPVIAAIQGGCIGGGMDLVTACDVRLASADAFFVVQETVLGVVADAGTLQRLPTLIPAGIARELALTGDRLPAARAADLGLVNAVYDTHDELIEAALAMGAGMAGRSPLVLWGTKEMINYSRDHSVSDGLNYVATWQTGMMQPGDMAETATAGKEKRPPDYPDLLPSADEV
jgi:enoyl-CoA hydratase